MEWILILWFQMGTLSPAPVVIEKFTTLTACEIGFASLREQIKDYKEYKEDKVRHVCIPRK